MFSPHKKRLLALDGGGIMGCISLGILAKIESDLRKATGNATFVLRDFFDYIGGTSTGAIIAAGLAIGKSVEEIARIYREDGAAMFTPAPLLQRWRHRYDARRLAKRLKAEFTDRSVLELLDNGYLLPNHHLLIVTRNVNTDSPWPISTNPRAKFNNRDRPDCNLQIPLWQLVRASTAAPTYFQPERLQWDPNDPDSAFMFEDGGVTPYNNPAFLLFRMATLPEYNCEWEIGEDRIMLISVGTGMRYRVLNHPHPGGESLLTTARTIPSELMRGMAVEVDITCRQIGRCMFGPEIDLEIGTLASCFDGELGTMKKSAMHRNKKAFLYARYDADISLSGLKSLNLGNIEAEQLEMDTVDAIEDLFQIGDAVAQEQVDLPGRFASFF